MDNKSGIDVAYNPEHHTRMKHVARRHFYVRELVEDHVLRCTFVSTVENLADFFTKPLKSSIFFPMRDTIMNIPPEERRSARKAYRAVSEPGFRPRGGVERSASEERM